MQGSFWVDSEWDKGSTFTLVIPAQEGKALDDSEPQTDVLPETEPLYSESVSAADHSPGEGSSVVLNQITDTVLVVEDNPDLRTYLATILSPSLTGQTAANGQVALDLLASLTPLPALIISDIMMPVMDGFQLLVPLRAHDTYRRVPVIMLTARAELTDKLRALRIGVDDCLLKPFDDQQ